MSTTCEGTGCFVNKKMMSSLHQSVGWHPYVSRDNRDNWLLTDSEFGGFSVFNKSGATSTIAVVTAVLMLSMLPVLFSLPIHAD